MKAHSIDLNSIIENLLDDIEEQINETFNQQKLQEITKFLFDAIIENDIDML